jgi:hypothetical protein
LLPYVAPLTLPIVDNFQWFAQSEEFDLLHTDRLTTNLSFLIIKTKCQQKHAAVFHGAL